MTATASTVISSDTSLGMSHGGVAAQLRRLRWAVRATLTLGVAASVAANVLHARPNPISQIIAAWPPLALLLTVELISRVPHHRRLLGAIRIAATTVIAGIATWVSYWHLAGVAARYGETEHGAAYLLPISVDGLVIVASVSLVELTASIRATAPAPRPVGPPAAAVDAAGHAAAAAGQRPRSGRTATTSAPTRTANSTAAPAPADTAAASAPHPRRPEHDDVRRSRADHNVLKETPAPSMPSEPAPHIRSHDGNCENDAAQDAPPPANGGGYTGVPMKGACDTPADDVPTDTGAAVAYWRRRDPHLHPADIATRIGKSERTVRRYLSQPITNGTAHVDRHLAPSRTH